MSSLLAAAAVLVLALAGVGALQILWPPIRDVPRSARLSLGYCTGAFLVTAIFFLPMSSACPSRRFCYLCPR